MHKMLWGINLLALLLLSMHIHGLWSAMHEAAPRRQISDAAAPPPFTPGEATPAVTRGRYSQLFDVQMPTAADATDAAVSSGAAVSFGETLQEVDELQVARGRMRLKAIFTSADTRLALVETSVEGEVSLAEIRESQTILGNRVVFVGPRHIELRPDDEGPLVRLVLFHRNRDSVSELQ